MPTNISLSLFLFSLSHSLTLSLSLSLSQTTPPEYHVGNLTVPVALFWGDNDFLADPRDVERLIPQIPHLIYNKEIKNFEHLDFIWAMDANKIVYNDILLIMSGKIPPH